MRWTCDHSFHWLYIIYHNNLENKKYNQMSTNKPRIGQTVLEIPLSIFINILESWHLGQVHYCQYIIAGCKSIMESKKTHDNLHCLDYDIYLQRRYLTLFAQRCSFVSYLSYNLRKKLTDINGEIIEDYARAALHFVR